MSAKRNRYIVFDQQGFNLVCYGNPALENTLLQAMPAALKSEIESLLIHLNCWETSRLMRQLHHLRGTLSGLGQSHLTDLIVLLEFNSRYNSPSQSLLSALLEKLNMLMSEMEDFSKMKQKISN